MAEADLSWCCVEMGYEDTGDAALLSGNSEQGHHPVSPSLRKPEVTCYVTPPSCPPKRKWSLGDREGGVGGSKVSRGLLKVGWESRKEVLHLHRAVQGRRGRRRAMGPHSLRLAVRSWKPWV